jgi:hypothetical protein
MEVEYDRETAETVHLNHGDVKILERGVQNHDSAYIGPTKKRVANRVFSASSRKTHACNTHTAIVPRALSHSPTNRSNTTLLGGLSLCLSPQTTRAFSLHYFS